jgi:hypothetical protein
MMRAAHWLLMACPPLGLSTILMSSAAAAIPGCTSAALRTAAPAGMSIRDIPNAGLGGLPKTVEGVADVAVNSAGNDAPEYCFVTGTVVTDSKSNKTANFAAELPAKATWNGKFLFVGCGGHCGVAMIKPSPAALRKGYAIFATDDGHVAPPGLAGLFDSGWAVRSPGQRDEQAVTDFYYRAVHAVVESGKQLTRLYYDAPNLSHAYFDGCSDGGREGMVELSRFPADFDGIIAGDPYFDIGAEIVNSLIAVQVQLRSPQAALSANLLTQVDHIVTSQCDATDGVSDGLIQNPGQCAFDPQKDLPKCGAQSSSQCFTQDQLDSLSAMLSAVTNPAGKVLYPGYPVAHLNDAGPRVDNLAFWVEFHGPPETLQGPEPWSRDPGARPIAWSYANAAIRGLIYVDEPNFDALKTPGIYFNGPSNGSIDAFHAVVPRPTFLRLARQSTAGNGDHPASAAEYFRHGHKLILYHGFADGDITPYRTIQYYVALAKLHGGYGKIQNSARLFLVPGMAHCSGGPGPNVFGQTGAVRAVTDPQNDVLAALERWVEKGVAPKSLVATKYEEDDPKRTVVRTMPLCPFPAMAHYMGNGDVNDAANWTCPTDDQRLLHVGHSGREAGSGAKLD